MEQLYSEMRKNGWQSFLVSLPANVRYVSGYTGADSYLLLTEGKKFFITDPRYTEQAAQECPDYTIFEWRPHGTLGKALAVLAEQEHLANMAFEATQDRKSVV